MAVGFDATPEVGQVRESLAHEETQATEAAHAVMAVGHQGALRIQFLPAIHQFPQRDVDGAGQVRQVEFPLLTHIQALNRVREVPVGLGR